MSGRYAFSCHFNIEKVKMKVLVIFIVLFVKHTDAVYSTGHHMRHMLSGEKVMVDIERRLSSLESDNRRLTIENQQIHKTNLDLKQEMQQVRAENQAIQKIVRQLQKEYNHFKQDTHSTQEKERLLEEDQNQHKITASKLQDIGKNIPKHKDIFTAHTEGRLSPSSVPNSVANSVISSIQQAERKLLNDMAGIHYDSEKFNPDLKYPRNMLVQNGKNGGVTSVVRPRNAKRESRKNVRVAVPTSAVAFHTRLSTNLNNPGDDQTIIMANVLTNEGATYDKLSGHFTCQVPGVYVFFVTAVSFRDKNIEIELLKNGQTIGSLVSGNSVYTGSSSNMVIVTAQTDDHVWLRVHDHYHDTGSVLDGFFTTFSGFLLH